MPDMNELPLHDIHLPEPVSWWPPAPGWWMLFIVFLAVVAVIIYRFLYRRRRVFLHKLAMGELQQIETRYAQNNDALELVRDLSILLRRITISMQPRSHSAGLTGEDWLQFLDEFSGSTLFSTESGKLLIEAPYRPAVDINGGALLECCRQWINAVTRKKGHHLHKVLSRA